MFSELMANIRRQLERDLFNDGQDVSAQPPVRPKSAQERYREWADEFNDEEDYDY